MPAPRKVTDEQIRDAIARCGTVRAAARFLEVHHSVLLDRGAKAVASPPARPPASRPPATEQETTELELAQRRIEGLTRQLREANERRLSDEEVRREILGLRNTGPTAPDWVLRPPSEGEGFAGAPTVARSDEHCGEVVDPAQVEGFNSYDLETFLARMKRMTERVIELCENHIAHRVPYPGLAVFGLGDGMTGEIHPELARTNDEDPGPCFLALCGARERQIEAWADHFGRVHVVEVPGNHPRMDEKWSCKGAAHRNWDWLAAHFVRKHFEDLGDDRVTFRISDGTDELVPIYGTRYLCTHGNQFRGGDGIIGPLGPITRGDNRKRARNVALGSSYDVLVLGHFHRLMMLRNLIVNGSVKGLDEYAYQGNFPPEAPMQALWLTHPAHGPTISMPVFLDEKRAAVEAPWLGRAAA